MAKTKLTRRMVAELTYEKKGNAKQILWDTEIPGLGIRVYPSGRKAWVVRYQQGGKERLYTLGDYPSISLDHARTHAMRVKAQVSLEGADPVQDRRRHAHQGISVRDVCHLYLEEYAKPRKKTWREDERKIEKQIIPALGSRRADEITRADVRQLHEKVTKNSGPYEANRLLALIRKIWNWALARELFEGTNPAQGVEANPETKRERWVMPHEMPRLLAALEEEANPWVRGVLWLYLLTGCRKEELLKARWDDVLEITGLDGQTRKVLRLTDTKSGEPQYVPLSSLATEILEELPRMKDNPYLFPGRAGSHLVNVSKPWNRIRERAGIPDVRLHDLRRTVGSWLSVHGADLNLIKTILRHKEIKTTTVYARLSLDPAQKALEDHGERIRQIVEKRA